MNKKVKKNWNNIPNQEIQKLIKRDRKFFNTSSYLLNTNIKKCFDKINHVWLLSNVPMPLGYNAIRYW